MSRADRLRHCALKAHRLMRRGLIGEDLARRLRTDVDSAYRLARAGALIADAEQCRLSPDALNCLRVIARVTVRNVMLGVHYARMHEVEFVGGKSKAFLQLAANGLIAMPVQRRIVLTRAGWAFVWATGMIADWRAGK
jgi:hypothetical protein